MSVNADTEATPMLHKAKGRDARLCKPGGNWPFVLGFIFTPEIFMTSFNC